MSRQNKVQIIHVAVLFLFLFIHTASYESKAEKRPDAFFEFFQVLQKRSLMNLGFLNLLSVEVQKVDCQVHNLNEIGCQNIICRCTHFSLFILLNFYYTPKQNKSEKKAFKQNEKKTSTATAVLSSGLCFMFVFVFAFVCVCVCVFAIAKLVFVFLLYQVLQIFIDFFIDNQLFRRIFYASLGINEKDTIHQFLWIQKSLLFQD